MNETRPKSMIRNRLLQNLANAVTLLGLIATIWLLLIALNNPNHLCLMILLAGFVGITDLVDGKLARRFNCRTTFGRLFDRIRDKIFIIPLLIILTCCHHWKITEPPFLLGTLTKTLVFTIILFEILLPVFWFAGLIKKFDIESNKWGKSKTFCEFLAIIFWLGSLVLEKHLGIPIIQFLIYLIILIFITAIFSAYKSLEEYCKCP